MSKDTTLNIKTPKNILATLPDYTLGEELINSISHGLGASFAIIALVPVSYTHLDVYKRQAGNC